MPGLKFCCAMCGGGTGTARCGVNQEENNDFPAALPLVFCNTLCFPWCFVSKFTALHSCYRTEVGEAPSPFLPEKTYK